MRIDAHHHFWRIGRYEYPWMAGEALAPIRRDFGPGELEPLLRENGIDYTVLVQTVHSLEETRWFLALGVEHSFIAGVVGWCDLTDAKVGTTLDELLASPGRLVGVRHQVEGEADDYWLTRREVGRGLNELSRRGLTYDLLIKPRHLAAALSVVGGHEGLAFVVDHLAKPPIAARGWDEWADGMRSLAARPNVWCKLSGMVTEADWAVWTPEHLRPYIRHVLEVFGPERLMFGSDWPVCLLAGSYARVIEALRVNLDDLDAAALAGIFGGNAARFYKLEAAHEA